MHRDLGWTPDRMTVQWWMGAVDEDRIVTVFTKEVRQRGADIRYDCDAYWQLAADVAMRLINDDMVTQAEDWIVKKPESKRWVELNEDEVIREWGVTSAAEALRKFDFLTWVPDMETVRWWTGLATGDRIVESLEGEVKERSEGIELHSNAYWHLVAEVAVEHMHYELYDTAIAWGTDVTDPSRPEQPPPL